jgi:hypothetical protein
VSENRNTAAVQNPDRSGRIGRDWGVASGIYTRIRGQCGAVLRDTTAARDPEELTATDHEYAGGRRNGSFVLYDAAREDAWIQSHVSLDLAEVA